MSEHKIIIGNVASPDYSIDNGQIRQITGVETLDIVGAELSIDKLTARVEGDANDGKLLAPKDYDEVITSDGFTLALQEGLSGLPSVPFGAEVRLSRDSSLSGKYYNQNIQRVSESVYKITAMSAIGLLDNLQHVGGVYTGQTFAAVVAEIIDGAIPYSVANDVAGVTIFGWLPVATKRQNLHQLLFATGAALKKDADGNARFVFLDAESTKEVPDERFYYGGNIDYSSPASGVEITEHSFYALDTDETITLFDNTDGSGAANNTFVAFQDAPIHNIEAQGALTVVSSGVNYAIVTGTGVLTGQKYTHTTKIVSKSASGNAAENVVTVTDATLVSASNSENVAKRVMAYYSSKKTVGAAIVAENEKPGDLITFTDPYGDQNVGYIASAETTVSTVLKSQCEIITDYVPTGQGNNYSSSRVLAGSGTFTVGENGARVHLIGGGSGGYSGGNGADGEAARASGVDFAAWGEGGDGGLPGPGGDGGKILVVTLSSGTYSYTCGIGGIGGVSESTDPTAGAQGGDTTIFKNGVLLYSSASGSSSLEGLSDIFSGNKYALPGNQDGVTGGKGGTRGSESLTAGVGTNGEDVTFEGETWTGGENFERYASNRVYWYGRSGGGAAVGENGEDGADVSSNRNFNRGGTGGSAKARTASTVYGCGGPGGHGGGGGGGGGGEYESGLSGVVDHWFTAGTGGTGGTGGDGGAGAPGCIVIYE